MAKDVGVKNTGLRGVTVADSKISFIDGEKGVLIYRGFRIEELAEKSSFEETAFLLLNDRLPNREEFERFNGELASARTLPRSVVQSFRAWPRDADPMDVLQATVPLLAMADPELKREPREANVRKAVRLLARMPAAIAAWCRMRSGAEPLPPDDSLSHSANFLWQFSGKTPDEDLVRALDVSMILQAEHTFNASTFACREVVSTGAHLYAGVAAGVGALSGSLHGGANARVVEMLFQLESEGKSPEDAALWVRQRLDRGGKIMGMGHAVYKTFDPRSMILKNVAQRLALKMGKEKLYYLLVAVEEECHKEFERRGKSRIKSNVDFFSGLVYHMMGIPVDIMTPLFAIAIATGWCSHIIEEKFAEAQEKPVLYRPEAEYIGRCCGLGGCEYPPMPDR